MRMWFSYIVFLLFLVLANAEVSLSKRMANNGGPAAAKAHCTVSPWHENGNQQLRQLPSSKIKPISNMSRERADRAATEADQLSRDLLLLSKALKGSLSWNLDSYQMINQEISHCRQMCYDLIELVKELEMSSKVISRIPVLGEPFLALLEPLQNLTEYAGTVFLPLADSLIETRRKDQQVALIFEECRGNIEKITASTTQSCTTLKSIAKLCAKIATHMGVVGNQLSPSSFNELEINMREASYLVDETQKKVSQNATLYFNQFLKFHRRVLVPLMEDIEHVIQQLLPLHTFCQNFFDYVAGPLENGEKWLEWFFSSSRMYYMQQQQSWRKNITDFVLTRNEINCVIPLAIQQRAKFASRLLRNNFPLQVYQQSFEDWIHIPLSSSIIIWRELNESLEKLAQSPHFSNLCRVQMTVKNSLATTRLESLEMGLYRWSQIAIRILACLVIPIELAKLSLVLLFRSKEDGSLVMTYENSRILTFVSEGVTMIMPLFFSNSLAIQRTLWMFRSLLVVGGPFCMLSTGPQQRSLLSFWAILPFVFLGLDMFVATDHKSASLVTVSLIGLAFGLHSSKRTLLQWYLSVIPFSKDVLWNSKNATEAQQALEWQRKLFQ